MISEKKFKMPKTSSERSGAWRERNALCTFPPLPRALRDRLQLIARERGTPLRVLVEAALEAALKRLEAKNLENLTLEENNGNI